MSYLTRYRITISNLKSDDVEPIFLHLKELTTVCSTSLVDADASVWEIGFEGPDTWYYWKTDILLLSKKYPESVFKVTGSGEEEYDQWRYYIQDGKSHPATPELVYPPFDKTKLQ